MVDLIFPFPSNIKNSVYILLSSMQQGKHHRKLKFIIKFKFQLSQE